MVLGSRMVLPQRRGVISHLASLGTTPRLHVSATVLRRRLAVVSHQSHLVGARLPEPRASFAPPGRAFSQQGTSTFHSHARLGGFLAGRFLSSHTRLFSSKRTKANNASTFSVAANPSPNKQHTDLSHAPPLPLRVAQVAAVTAIATPAFPAIAVVNLALRVMLPDPVARRVLAQNLSTVLSLAAWTVLPYTYHIAPILLPFALANGACAGAGYLALDLYSQAYRKDWLHRPLIAGGGLGALTGWVAPPFLYGPAYQALYGIEGLAENFFAPLFWYTPLVDQISVATGAVAGLALYPLLYYPILGVRGTHWGNLSGLVLLTSGLTMMYLYDSTTSQDALMVGIYEGSFVPAAKVPLLDSMVRYRVASGALETWSWSQAAWVGPGPQAYQEGQALATQARTYHKKNYGGSVVTMDNQILTLLNTWVDDTLHARYPRHVVAVPAPPKSSVMRAKHASMVQTDLVWAQMIMTKPTQAEEAERLADQLKQLCGYSSMSGREFDKLCRSAEDISVAVELFFLVRRQSDQKLRGDVPMEKVEAWIRQRAPGILLLASDEPMGAERQSIESQLASLGNRKPSALADALEEWHHVVHKERRETRQQQMFAVAGVILGALSVLLMASTSGS
jgi:hypothetical protein